MKNFLTRLFLPYSWRVFKNPVAGEEWGFINRAQNPWDEHTFCVVYVKDVQNGWVCYTLSKHEFERNSPPSQFDDEFCRIGEFKERFSEMSWLKGQLLACIMRTE